MNPCGMFFATLTVFIALTIHEPAEATEEVDFARDVAPIFTQHCVRCHLPGLAKGGFSLATFEGLESGGHVEAGDADASYLIELIEGTDGDPPAMPQDGPPLSSEQIKIVREWIDSGALWPDDLVLREESKADDSWWSLQPLSTSSISKETTIDSFVKTKLAESNLSMNPRADRRTLIRRASFDLLGLPPTPEEVEAFVSDPDPNAYARLIDRLLASPHYGERWGRHWLDVVRFGESNGFEQNFLLNDLWPFRDYVIQSLNEDKPFDEFIREHIAGDVIAPNEPGVAIGSAFLVAGPYDSVNNQDAEQAAQIRANTLDEMISATSGAFLGMTVGCARCHDHKFDPITQEDYYSLYATFSGVRHGSVTLATPEQRKLRAQKLGPLNRSKKEIDDAVKEIDNAVLTRAVNRLDEFEALWTRPAVDRTGTEDTISPTEAKYVRLICEGTDSNPRGNTFKLDEFEIWTHGESPRNVALSSNGASASGEARINEDFPGVYGPHLAIDGKSGARFLSASNSLTIQLAETETISRFVFWIARGESNPAHQFFDNFPAEYRIETSLDGKSWTEVSSGRSRRPVNDAHRDHRLLTAEITQDENERKQQLRRESAKIAKEIAKVPKLPKAWIGTRNSSDAAGPFHVFIGGSPQRKGNPVVPASLSMLQKSVSGYELTSDATESQRRIALANWITRPDNPLTARVLANRVWHYHFGTGIVDTPSDFGYMGGPPSHPELLDYLALKLIEGDWRLKSLHREIMLSDAYQQSSLFRSAAARIDGDARLLWRFPPRRLSSEEVRDTMLQVAGKLDRLPAKLPDSSAETDESAKPKMVPDGGPGFRLYRFMRDNVSTYSPLDSHGADTYRRAVYHQNARASVVDLMTEFDQPDCTFSAPRRAETTTPLQALSMLNHQFTLDMSNALAERLKNEVGDDIADQLGRAFQLCYSRDPQPEELTDCSTFVQEHGLPALCRVLLNTSELIYLGSQATTMD
ncbi:MAG TPA: hypothetical protein DDW52_15645 [Planctomycetaceae bacterium]|nr:hypothetical protein [Planctomycetaceae bacterium]